MKTTSFNVIIEKFLRKIEKDRDFFTHYNISFAEAMKLAVEQSENYLIEAIDKLTDKCSPDVDFYDYNYNEEEKSYEFNFSLTKREIGLFAELMREVYFDRDFSKLKAFKIAMTPSDLNQFSPASERSSYVNMVKEIKQENDVRISQYIAMDRLTGKPKTIDYSKRDW